MLVAVALLALVLPSRMVAAASARMILGNGCRRKCNNGENGKNATEINHIFFPKIGAQSRTHSSLMVRQKFANDHAEFFLIHDRLAKVPERWLFRLTIYPCSALETTVRRAFANP
ncbi:MAG: hypothetical protein ABSE50_08135 [Xanthobacteraceae bacterium]